MKKILTIVFTMVLAIGVLSGCGKGDDKEASALTEVTTQEETNLDEGDSSSLPETQDATQEDDSNSDSSEAIKTFVEQSQLALDNQADANKGVMEASVTSEGETITYTYKYLDDLGDLEVAKGLMDTQMQSQEESMNIAIGSLKTMGVSNPVIILEYINSDGTEIASYEFK